MTMMNRFLFLLLLTALGIASAFGQPAKARNVILFGWDGAQRAHVGECLQRGELPVLQAVSAAGSLVEIDIRGTTDTKAGWTQILTGYDPEITGVYSNRKYQPIPAGLSVFERIEQQFGASGVATIAVIGKKGHVDNDGPVRLPLDQKMRKKLQRTAEQLSKEYGDDINPSIRAGMNKVYPGAAIVTEEGKKYLAVPGKPYFNTSKGMDLFLNGLKRDSVVAARTVELLASHGGGPFFFFVHFAEIDHSGHQFGENSAEYNDAIRSADRWTGFVLEYLKSRGLDGATDVFITADHGFNEGETHHKSAPQVFLASTRKGVRNGDRADITPTIYAALGMPAADLLPALSGKSLLAK